MTTLKPYPKMKDSGVEWLGDVPEHWEVVPLCSVAKTKSISGKNNRELLSVYLGLGVVRFSDVQEKRTNVTSEDLSKYQAVDPGDFVLNNQQAWRGSVGVSRYSGIVSPAYLVLSLNSHIDSDYANKLFRDQSMVSQYLAASKGVGTIQRNLYWPHLRRASTLLPPLPEQTAIVRYLDYMDRRIRRLIRTKRKLITLLNEQKQVIIHHAVTRGLDPNVPLKDSGVEWLGMVPQHWEVVPLKRMARTKSGDGISNEIIEPILNDPYNYPVIGGNGLIGYTKSYNVNPNVIVIGRVGALCGNVHEIYSYTWVTDNALVLYFKEQSLFLKYLSSVLRARNLNDLADKTAQPLITGTKVRSESVPVPPLQEQTTIVEYLDQATSTLDTTITRAQREIDLLTEYRTRLIADVVTGKVDVREVAAGLPEVDPLAGVDEVEDGLGGDVDDGAEDVEGLAEEVRAPR